MCGGINILEFLFADLTLSDNEEKNLTLYRIEQLLRAMVVP